MYFTAGQLAVILAHQVYYDRSAHHDNCTESTFLSYPFSKRLVGDEKVQAKKTKT